MAISTVDPLLKRYEVGVQLRISERTVDHLISSGQLAYCRVGGQIRIRQSHVDEYLDRATRDAAS